MFRYLIINQRSNIHNLVANKTSKQYNGGFLLDIILFYNVDLMLNQWETQLEPTKSLTFTAYMFSIETL